MLSETAKALVKELKKIWDDEDFVLGAMTNLKTEEYFEKMLDFIHIARQQGDKVTSDEILYLSLVFSREKREREAEDQN